MNNSDLSAQIVASINNPTTLLWFPNLTHKLVEFGFESVKNKYGISLGEYGTNRIWFENKNAPLNIITNISNSTADKHNQKSIQIEILEKKIADYYKDQIKFYVPNEVVQTSVFECVVEAIEIIKIIPTLLETVFQLVHSLHLIKLESNDYDVSFSEPHIPFSIFISVPLIRIEADSLRVAEAIVHESMHLQLSLIERVLSLVKSSDKKFYSPWKQELRESQGILHALYVFRVIEDFYKMLGASIYSKINLSFIQRRQQEISTQVAKIQNFTQSSDLTVEGRLIVKRLLDSNNQYTLS